MSEAKSIAEVIEIAGERFKQIAPQHMKYEAEKGFAIQLLRNNDYLMSVAQGSPQSLQQAITNVAAIGLSLNPAEKLAYLITRTIKTKDASGRDKWEARIFLEPSYVGLCKLATDSGSIEWIHAACVHEHDTFIDNGPGEKPTHQYQAFRDRGEVVGVFCTAKTLKGDYLTTVMDMVQINSIRDRSEAWKAKMSGKAKTGGPWETDPKEMARKTVVRNAFKLWPRTDERRYAMLAEAVNISNENEGFEPIQTEPSLATITPDQKAYFDQLIEKSDAVGMYLFEMSMREQSEAAWINLYHSFPKGSKGKYQKVVEQLCASGRSLLTDMADQVRIGIESNDDLAVKEIVENASQSEMDYITDQLSREEQAALKSIMEQN